MMEARNLIFCRKKEYFKDKIGLTFLTYVAQAMCYGMRKEYIVRK